MSIVEILNTEELSEMVSKVLDTFQYAVTVLSGAENLEELPLYKALEYDKTTKTIQIGSKYCIVVIETEERNKIIIQIKQKQYEKTRRELHSSRRSAEKGAEGEGHTAKGNGREDRYESPPFQRTALRKTPAVDRDGTENFPRVRSADRKPDEYAGELPAGPQSFERGSGRARSAETA